MARHLRTFPQPCVKPTLRATHAAFRNPLFYVILREASV
jgi:hypothetical protein